MTIRDEAIEAAMGYQLNEYQIDFCLRKRLI